MQVVIFLTPKTSPVVMSNKTPDAYIIRGNLIYEPRALSLPLTMNLIRTILPIYQPEYELMCVILVQGGFLTAA
jgi:hypothetical protein